MIRNAVFVALLFFTISCATDNEEADLPSVQSGKIERIINFQTQFVTPRNIDIWLPENYDSLKAYSVLYMHDGQMLYDAETTWNNQEWKADETAGQLIKSYIVDPFIIVGIWNAGSDRYMDYFPQKPFEQLPKTLQDSLITIEKRTNKTRKMNLGSRADDYLKFIVQELKPYVDSHYFTYKNKENTFIAGSSMGGLISWYALCEYPEIFGGAACLSTHWPGIFHFENNPIPKVFAAYLSKNLPDPESHKLYFDTGTETLDSMYPPVQKMIDSIFIERGIASEHWQSRIFVGENHSEESWSRRLYIPFTYLLSNKHNSKVVLFTENIKNTSEQTCGYISTSGDTIIAAGKYTYCFTDTLTDFAIVVDEQNHFKAVNVLGNEMYEVYKYDNGPDLISDDRFRILKDSMIGFANSRGDIRISPRFKCASPFEDGRAKVSYDCVLQKLGEHLVQESNHWLEIDKDGVQLQR
jgi:enterochelin esterase-like enzyme